MLSLVMWASVAFGQADAPTREDLPTQVRQLVRELNDDELTVRDSAEQKLVKLGPDTLSLLPEESQRMPAEQVQRLARVRQALLKAQATAGAQASLVTLKLDNVPAAEVLAEIAKQTGNKIVNHLGAEPEGGKTKISVDFEKKPFWQALDDVLDQSKLTLYSFSNDGSLSVADRPPGRLPRSAKVAYSGPFRLEPTRFEALSMLSNPEQRSLKLFFEVAWEPRLAPIAVSQPLDQVQVAFDKQPEKTLEAAGEIENAVTEGTPVVEVMIPLPSPPRKIEKISKLKGRLNVLMPTPQESFRFDQLPVANNKREFKKIEQRKGKVVVTLDQVRKTEEIWEVRMRVHFDEPAQALESHRTWILNNGAYFVDADKNKKSHDGCEETRQTENELGIMYLFELPQGVDKMSFVYETPLAILPLPVDYEFKDLPLP